jgi:acetolactate synthase-1/2/3 large subunit
MKLTGYVIDFLANEGIKHIFGFTGGGVVHFFDSADKNQNIQTIFCHHEQAVALAAVSYSRLTGNLGAAIVTTGPGGTNTLTGVLAAWQDSIPVIFISGQSRLDHTSRGKSLRQLGTQEIDILSVVKHITKYAEMIEDHNRVRYHLEKAVHFAREGRPGPVWLDVPLDFQWAEVNPNGIQGFASNKQVAERSTAAEVNSIPKSCKQVLSLISKAERPLILAGHGIHSAHAEARFAEIVRILNIPFVSTWTASDIIATDHPRYVGRIGIAGQRGANLAVQNCDLLLCIGSHLSIPLTGTMLDAFAREAKIIVVDIDDNELRFRDDMIDLAIRADVGLFLDTMLKTVPTTYRDETDPWLAMCSDYRVYNKVPICWLSQSRFVNPYIFMDSLSDELKGDEVIVVDGGGTNLYISFQALRIKKGQRLIVSSAISAMGTGLPESIGACVGNDRKTTICLTGDGSLQLNIQELQTILFHKLPIKIFVMNNNGYLAIRHTQTQFLGSNYVGSSSEGGMTLPDFKKVAKAYGINVARISNHKNMRRGIRSLLKNNDPVLCEVLVDPCQQLIAQQGFDANPDGTFSPRPLEDMYPFLDREEFRRNMVIRPWSNSRK